MAFFNRKAQGEKFRNAGENKG